MAIRLLAKRKRPWSLAGILCTVSFSTALSPRCSKIGVIGGGASGIFAAISAAESYARKNREHPESSNVHVVVLEATTKTLQKVKISGGGRCNVLHDTSKTIPTILAGYPRGKQELNGLFQKRFTPTMAQEWFEHRGVQLKLEDDGRMFPITDSSQTIIDALLEAAEQAGVEIRLKQNVNRIERSKDGSFKVHFKDESIEEFRCIILATGSSPVGYELAKSLGHDPLVHPVPSLFTLNCKHAISPGGVLHGLSGVSVPSARVSVSVPSKPNRDYQQPEIDSDDVNKSRQPKRKLKVETLMQEGPLLITHQGISGPAVLRLSAFGARELRDMNYRGNVVISWDIQVLGSNAEDLLEELWKFTMSNPKRSVASACPLWGNSIPRRLWSSLVVASGFTTDATWGNAPKKLVRQLALNLVSFPMEFTGKGTFKDEFVTAGGVDLKDIDMKTMESKICPGLFFCGEVLNVDGITGGYNFMNCWSTGYVAGEASSSLTQLDMN
jgi:predicted flavoprotein YhiN